MFRFLAQLISVIAHPLFILTYVLLLMLLTNPFEFGVSGLGEKRSMELFFGVFFTTALIPSIGVFLMKGLGFVQSLAMEDKQERIGPYILSGVFYLWLFKNLLSGGNTPLLYTVFVLGATISLFLVFFINIFTKISAHASGMGGLVAMILLLIYYWYGNGMVDFGIFSVSWLVVLIIVVILAGAVGTARLSLEAHTPADLWRGYAVGFAGVFLANMLI